MGGARIIDGRAIAQQLQREIADRVALLSSSGVQPGLAFVRVGEDDASRTYVGMKEKVSRELGIFSQTFVLPGNSSENELLSRIARLNQDPRVHGILVQSPVPGHIQPEAVFTAVAPEKDVDGFHPLNLGKLVHADDTGFVPCTPAGVQMLLSRANIPIAGAHVVILGRGLIVGKPLALLLLFKQRHANATVTICHSQSTDIKRHCREADILVAAMGSANFVTGDMVKPGAVVVDVGVNRLPDASSKSGSRLVGDVNFAEVEQVAGAITPNPGGVGPMTVACLMNNTVKAAEMSGRSRAARQA